MAQYLMDLLYSLESCLTCFGSPTLNINRHNFKILKLLGEGGFSYVYLVQSQNGDTYALKKIRCPFGAESIQVALREVDAYKRFDSKYIIRAIDSSVVQEKDGSKTVYILLPFYKHGNLQDKINSNLVNNRTIPEPELVKLFSDICLGIKAMHDRHINSSTEQSSYPSMNSQGYSEMDNESQQQLLEDADVGNDSSNDTAMDTIVPFAHRDIKPANIMLDDNRVPVLMDLGSCSRARMKLTTRQAALELQDLAAEHCTLPYRAPELFDVKTDSSVDERVDIWSLGCTLFALMYSTSPFEMQTAESGASLNLAIMNGQYKFPAVPGYSEDLKAIVRKCLTVDPEERPFIKEIIDDTQRLLSAST